MNMFQKLAKENRPAFEHARKQFQKECREYSVNEFVRLPEDELSKFSQQGKGPIVAYRNRHFLAALYLDDCNGVQYGRLSVNRTKVDNDGGFVGDITWDELMEVKRGIGMGGFWMTEVYPPEPEIVNVANMRHLFMVNQPPFAWVRKAPAMPKRNPMLKGLWKTLAGMLRGKEGK